MNAFIGLLLICVCHIAFASPRAKVFVVGSIHNLHKSSVFTEAKFTQLLESIQPDIVLFEFPIDWIDANNNPTSKLKKSLEDESQKDGVRDGQLAWKYCVSHSVPCKPFDIKGRNDFFKKHRVFERLKIFEAELTRYVQIFPAYRTALEGFSKLYDECLNSKPETLNGKVCNQAMRSREDYAYQLYLKAKVSKDFKDKDFYQLQKDFWDLRNKTMAENICLEAVGFSGKNIAVITGVDHHFYLMDLLAKCESAHVKDWF